MILKQLNTNLGVAVKVFKDVGNIYNEPTSRREFALETRVGLRVEVKKQMVRFLRQQANASCKFPQPAGLPYLRHVRLYSHHPFPDASLPLSK
jgi:hypothetical protein